MIVESSRPEGFQLEGQLPACGDGKRRGYANVVQTPLVVVQPEEQRAHQIVLAGLVPAKAGDDAIRRSRVLHFDHRALTGFIWFIGRLCDYTVEARALE